jgi:hypothetical protein
MPPSKFHLAPASNWVGRHVFDQGHGRATHLQPLDIEPDPKQDSLTYIEK